jgi:hypothetical protein
MPELEEVETFTGFLVRLRVPHRGNVYHVATFEVCGAEGTAWWGARKYDDVFAAAKAALTQFRIDCAAEDLRRAEAALRASIAA